MDVGEIRERMDRGLWRITRRWVRLGLPLADIAINVEVRHTLGPIRDETDMLRSWRNSLRSMGVRACDVAGFGTPLYPLPPGALE